MTEVRQTEDTGRSPRGAGVTVSLQDRELIDHYLAGRLDAATEAEVDARIVGDAAFRREVELTDELRAGLRDLDGRGELHSDVALTRMQFWQRPAYALAASVVAGLLGLTALALYGQLQRGRVELAEVQRAMERLRPVAITGLRVERVVRTRAGGGEPDLVLQGVAPNELIELQVDVGDDPAVAYRVQLDRVEAGSAVVTLMDVASVATSAQGQVLLTIYPALMPHGDYVLTMLPVDETVAERMTYRLRVTE